MKKRVLFFIILFSAGLFVFLGGVSAETINAASCSQSDVQSAINSANPGDLVNVPTGNCIWDQEVIVGKAITINGNGATLTASGILNHGFFSLSSFSSSLLMRITGFTFKLNNINGGSAMFFYVGLSLTNFRFDNNTVHDGAGIGEFYGCKGVVDGNTFYNPVHMFVLNGGTRQQADASWNSMAAGTGDALFIEDNTIIYDSNWTGSGGNDVVFDTNNGGKLVFRYNEIDMDSASSSQTWWALMIHGNAAGGCTHGYWESGLECRRGQSVVEIYNNYIHGKLHPAWYVSRGSANLVHDNVITSTRGIPYTFLREEESYLPDQFIPSRTLWPAEDQVHNSFFWNNTYNTLYNDSDLTVETESESSVFIQKNRDYFLHAPCNALDTYDSYGNICTYGIETFTGVNGASNTYPTNGIVYATQGTMIFTPNVTNAYYGYTPYTYPHPLRNLETEPVCGDGVCEGGENCPADSSFCSDNACYEPTCTNGCGQTAVAYGDTDEGCVSPNYCDGFGFCTSSLCTSGADKDSSGDVTMTELMNYILDWKSGIVTMTELMNGISEWKNGC